MSKMNDYFSDCDYFPVADLNGSAKPEQAKTINVTANGTQTVTPDSGYALSSVTVNTNVPSTPTQTKEVDISQNGETTISPDSGYTLSSVAINVNVPAPAVETQEKSVTITQNGASEVTPDTGKYLSKVSITTNVEGEATPTQEKTQEITSNTTTVITPDEGYALSSVTVVTDIPATPTQTKTVDITSNGQTTVLPDAGYNLSGVTVNVNVPAPASKLPSVIDKSVTEITAEDLGDITSIGLYAFYDCQNLTSITIPASVTSIGDHALQCGSQTNKVTITMLGSTPPTISSTTMQYDNIAQIIVPEGSVLAYTGATNWANYSALIIEANN